MWMVKNPEWFDVIVTGNMFGDIITDLAAMTQGGMGIAAGGNINPEGVSMFEPIGGSAPKYTGQNVINPLAGICAGGMMLETLGEAKAADKIEKAVMDVTGTKLKSLAAGKMGYSTTEVGDLVAERVTMNFEQKLEDVVGLYLNHRTTRLSSALMRNHRYRRWSGLNRSFRCGLEFPSARPMITSATESPICMRR